MKKAAKTPDMLPEYDFSGGVRGKYAQRVAEESNVVVIDPALTPYFPNQEAVNDALRHLAAVIKKQRPPRPAAAPLESPGKA